MNGTTKFLIGAAVTSLMAMASHSALGLGGKFISGLQGKAETAVGGLGLAGVKVAMMENPSLNRIVRLSGSATEAQKAAAIAAARAIPGVKDAIWVDEPGAVAPVVVADKGPPATAEQVKDCQSDVDAVIKGKTIQFDTAAATIKPESQALIDALAGALAACAGTTVEVAGHTDVRGDENKNMRLSEERANSVVAALVAKNIPASRLMPKGYGETKPLGADDAANRRIEFAVAASKAAPTADAPAAAPAAPAKQ
jgi:outer membrane protein OmpA-like peptidoglycan-associated protein